MAEAARVEHEATRIEAERPARRILRGRGRVVRLPGPEALLHPDAADALIEAFRPRSGDR